MTPLETVPATSTQQRLERLVVTTSGMVAEVSIEGVLRQVVGSAAELIGAHYAAVGVLAPDGRLLESFTTHGVDDELRARIGAPPRGHGILGLVIREARPIRLPDLTKHPDSGNLRRKLSQAAGEQLLSTVRGVGFSLRRNDRSGAGAGTA